LAPARCSAAARRSTRRPPTWPVSNRLEVIEDAGVTWIRDAYNSNQFGFRAALEVAADLPVTRRFLVTPGVIELGAEQHPACRMPICQPCARQLRAGLGPRRSAPLDTTEGERLIKQALGE
jgi:hypothetical protein